MTTSPDLSTLTSFGDEATSVTLECREVKCRVLQPTEVNANWQYLQPIVSTVGDPNGILAMLLSRETYLLVAEVGKMIGAAALVTIGKHGASDGYNSCFIDGLAIANREMAEELLRKLTEFICYFAASCECNWVIGDTPNAKLVSIAEKLGFRSSKMYKLRRKVNELVV